MGISLFLELPAIVSYWVVTVMCFVAMGVSTMFVVQIYTLVQTQTPPQLVGKIMATLVAVAMCGQPIGQMVYGILFDVFIQETWVVMFVASIACTLQFMYLMKHLVQFYKDCQKNSVVRFYYVIFKE